jgi:hypothetical protein
MTHHMTNWIGDDGFLVSSATKIRRHNPEGDTLFIDGAVTGKFERDGNGFVEVAHEARNQDGELSILGTAVAQLPMRGQ